MGHVRRSSWGVLIALFAAGGALRCTSNAPASSATPDAGVQARATTPSTKPEVARKVVPVTTASAEAREAFEAARRLAEDNREAESIEGFRRAVALDPQFALAHAYLGYLSPGAEGVAELRRAVALSEQLSEPERLFIGLLAACRDGDQTAAATTVRRLLQVAPDEWRASFELGNQAYEQRDWRLAINAYRRSMELADLTQTCVGYNNLGYAQAMYGHFELALRALQKCADLQPNEPNPQDSLGEVALAAGRLDESERFFQRAIELDPKFSYAWQGLAAVRFFRGDGEGFTEALRRARELSIGSDERAATDVLAAWMYLAADRGTERALRQLAVLESEARALGAAGLHDVADAAIQRSAILLEAGNAEQALASAEVALQRASLKALPGGLAQGALRRALLRKVLALLELGRVKEADAALARLVAASGDVSGNPEAKSGLHFARGAVAVARGDLAAAKAELSGCLLFGLSERSHDHRIKPEDSLCLLRLAEVQERSGAAAEAAATRQTLRAKLFRDPVAMYAWSRAAPVEAPRSP